jgi:hypothetical protein
MADYFNARFDLDGSDYIYGSTGADTTVAAAFDLVTGDLSFATRRAFATSPAGIAVHGATGTVCLAVGATMEMVRSSALSGVDNAFSAQAWTRSFPGASVGFAQAGSETCTATISYTANIDFGEGAVTPDGRDAAAVTYSADGRLQALEVFSGPGTQALYRTGVTTVAVSESATSLAGVELRGPALHVQRRRSADVEWTTEVGFGRGLAHQSSSDTDRHVLLALTAIDEVHVSGQTVPLALGEGVFVWLDSEDGEATTTVKWTLPAGGSVASRVAARGSNVFSLTRIVGVASLDERSWGRAGSSELVLLKHDFRR